VLGLALLLTGVQSCAAGSDATSRPHGVDPRSASASAAAAQRSSVPELPLGLTFSFHAGAPLGGPAGIGMDGSLLAGTTDGYLHALRPDGSFLWSYTVRGRVLGRPAWSPEGVALASAQQSSLYAVDAGGDLAWTTTVPGGVTSAPLVDAEGKVWVTTGGGTLLAFGRRGGVSGFARIGPGSALGPVLLESGEVAVANAEGVLRVAGPYGRLRVARVDGPVRELRAGAGGLFVLNPRGLARFAENPLEQRWARSEVTGIACTKPALVALEGGQARWLSAEGEPGRAVTLQAAAAPVTACLGDGSLLFTSPAGLLVRVSEAGRSSDRHIPAGRVLGLDVTPAGLVVVSYADGRIIGIEAPP
jgi:hypothetical protein